MTSPGTVVVAMCHDRRDPQRERASDTDALIVGELDEVIKMNGSVNVGPFQAEILEGRVTRAPTNDTHVRVVPIRHAEVESGRA